MVIRNNIQLDEERDTANMTQIFVEREEQKNESALKGQRWHSTR